MRERDINRKLFHRGHYEIIAGRFRNALEPLMGDEDGTAANVLVDLALNFAHRLQADNEDFDPVLFLNRCSPNKDEWPIGDLWAVENGRD
jgi:hypothetical protein